MKRIILFLVFITIALNGYSNDSCTFSVSIDCPKSDSKYWKGLIIVTSSDNKYFFIYDSKEKMTLPKGVYKFNLSSRFSDNIDTTIILVNNVKKITIKINWRYIFQEYSSSVFKIEGDSIGLFYKRMYSKGGTCNNFTDRDKMEIFQTKDGQYFAHHSDSIIIENNYWIGESKTTTYQDKLLSEDKTAYIKNYFQSNFVAYDKKERYNSNECIVKIGRHIYALKPETYIKLREYILR